VESIVRHRIGLAVVAVALLTGCAHSRAGQSAPRTTRLAVLNRLRDEINTAYSYRDGAPRINLGPCGRLARDFRERWNARFVDPVHILFVMAGDGSQCYHVLVRLPDGNCYDGGNGVISDRALLTLYPGSTLEDMTTFDPALLDRRSYGLGRGYPECPNYSDDLTRRLIDRHLAMLKPER
jgi:hypothetical protein